MGLKGLMARGAGILRTATAFYLTRCPAVPLCYIQKHEPH